jgi:TBC1 domain family protein 5
LPFGLALRIWDGVFAEDPDLGLLDFICIAMLLLIRNECKYPIVTPYPRLADHKVIEADYPTLLTQLLHYPAPSTTYPFDPSLIISQAIFLRGNVSPASGVEVVLQNQDLLGVKAQPPERDRSDEPVRIRGQRGPVRGRQETQIQAQQRGAGVQGFAQGWIDRAQAAGLDKAVLSAVSDLRVGHLYPTRRQY